MGYETALFYLVMLVAVVEVALTGWWVPFYFQYGVPVFRARRIGVPTLPPDAEGQLAERGDGRLMRAFAFRRLSTHEIAFRERMWGSGLFRYTPLMHGLIRHVPEEGAIYVTGLLNWYPAAFISFFAVVTGGDVPMTLIAVGGVALIYSIQARRYRRVADELSGEPVQTSGAR
jgi:hypothetical protein